MLTDEVREQAILRIEKGEKIYSHQRLVTLYMEHEKMSLEEAIEATDFDMATYRIEMEPEHDWTKMDWTKV